MLISADSRLGKLGKSEATVKRPSEQIPFQLWALNLRPVLKFTVTPAAADQGKSYMD